MEKANTNQATRSQPEYVVVGHVSKAHGTKGELYVWPLTDRPDDVFAPEARLHLGDRDGNPVRIPETVLAVDEVRPFQKGFLVRFRGITDRTAAERLSDQYLLVPFKPAADRAPNEFYYHELLGLEVRTVAGEGLGKVREVFELSPDHLLEVEGARGELLVPLNQRFVTEVDLEGGQITVDPPPGFLELHE